MMRFVSSALLLAAPCVNCGRPMLDLGAMTPAAVVLAGFADGFNPCAFSIVIVLAGILASGGRSRRARLWGGFAFTLASFATYVAMGLGFLRALRTLAVFQWAQTLLSVFLSSVLFVLAFLSVRDALRYRRVREASVIALQLPEGVKRTIREVATRSWKGPAVVLTGLSCGVVVTLLDSLCTGQVYVPVLALIGREVGAGRQLALLLVYNLAFITPLIALFVLAAVGTAADTFGRWSKRNVVPAKLALGVVFLLLALLTMPRFGGAVAEWTNPRPQDDGRTEITDREGGLR